MKSDSDFKIVILCANYSVVSNAVSPLTNINKSSLLLFQKVNCCCS